MEEVDEGELLVLRRTLNGLKGNQDEQRENMFHSRCTARGRFAHLSLIVGDIPTWHL